LLQQNIKSLKKQSRDPLGSKRMPLKSLGEPALSDRDGISFAMTDGSRRMVFRVPYDDLAEMARVSTVEADEGLETFNVYRGEFEEMASAIFDAGH
jgi:hypothetical protein